MSPPAIAQSIQGPVDTWIHRARRSIWRIGAAPRRLSGGAGRSHVAIECNSVFGSQSAVAHGAIWTLDFASYNTGIAVQGNSTLFITQLPTLGFSGQNGGRNTVDMIKLGNGEIVNLTTGEPEPTNLSLDKHGTLYWTCKSAGAILERSKKGKVSLFLGGLVRPSGISADKRGNIFFTQLLTPGTSGMNGGLNTVNVSDGDEIEILTLGEPEPTDIVVSKDGDAYWTCKSAGVILKHSWDGVVSLVLNNLQKPTGIAIDKHGRNLVFTEVPTPGLPGMMGGMNRVSRLDLETGEVDIANFGDPEPTDIAVNSKGDLYCSSAGVIVEATLIKD